MRSGGCLPEVAPVRHLRTAWCYLGRLTQQANRRPTRGRKPAGGRPVERRVRRHRCSCPSGLNASACQGPDGSCGKIFQGNPAVSKGEQITTMDFDASAVCPCSRECPLRHSPLFTDKMTRVAPMGIGEGCPDLREASSHGLTAYVPSPAHVRTCRAFEDTILRHE